LAVPHEELLSLAVALAAGFLVGLERERAGATPDRSQFAGGARTHPLVAASGALSVIVAREAGAAVTVGALAALIVLLAAGFIWDLARGGARGITSEVAFVVSFLLGALAASRDALRPAGERYLAVAATAIVATVLLSAKPLLHPLVQRLTQTDLVATLKLLVIAVVVLPLLPHEKMGPLRALDPFQIGLIVVLLGAVDFVGYAAVRLLGAERGLALTGLVGGLASSTAVTLSMAARARSEPALWRGCLVATVLAGGIMFARVAVLLAVTAPMLLGLAAAPLGAAAGTMLAVAALLHVWKKQPGGNATVELSNPLQLSSVLKFGVLLSVVFLASKAAVQFLGTAGTYVAALLAGLGDVDAITLSMAELARGGLARPVAAAAVLLAAASITFA